MPPQWRYADLCAVVGPRWSPHPLGNSTSVSPNVSRRAPAPCGRAMVTSSHKGGGGGAGGRGCLFRY